MLSIQYENKNGTKDVRIDRSLREKEQDLKKVKEILKKQKEEKERKTDNRFNDMSMKKQIQEDLMLSKMHKQKVQQ